ncbi:MAG: secondary thiamine-phosphate synthase enzyme YjbQ [Armatimonadota bacterium]|nr:secondary thiamine-phosphate synthase enzyme YjbQ [Armatimonadota bacterium]MCX7776453.1 secondary thiamine-phosphate synthase enzyme YjbQ [Armatimonadota bacterium]MDW8024251.1 secondary thiamine-phosphate synthase enzyme YjbQ [Armatimonadota bacterium]
MKGTIHELTIQTDHKEQLVDITDALQKLITDAGLEEGFVCIYVPHTTAAVSIHRDISGEHTPKLNELLRQFNHIVSNSPEYTKAALVAPTEVILVKDGKLLMGDDQRIIFYEFDGPRERRIYVYFSP